MQPNKRFAITLSQTWLCFAFVAHTITHISALCRHGAVCSHMTGVLCFFIVVFFFFLLEIDWLNSSTKGFIIFITKKRENYSLELVFPTTTRPWCLLSTSFDPTGACSSTCEVTRSFVPVSPIPHPALLLEVLMALYVHAAPQGFFFHSFFFFYCLVFLFSPCMGHIYIYTGCLTAEPFFIVSLGMFEIRRLQAAY